MRQHPFLARMQDHHSLPGGRPGTGGAGTGFIYAPDGMEMPEAAAELTAAEAAYMPAGNVAMHIHLDMA